MSIRNLQAIDVHAHYGNYVGSEPPFVAQLLTADIDEVRRRARIANTQLTVVSPLRGFFPRAAADPVAGNEEAARLAGPAEGICYWAVVDPTEPRTYQQSVNLLAQDKCLGIKIHPEEHAYPITEYGRAIFEFAAKHNAVLITHSGESKSMPEDFVTLANSFPEVSLILAHLGCGSDGDPTHQVRAIQASRHGNMFVDTSSAKNVMPGLIEWGVKEIGAEHVLYGTDSPLYFAPMQRARIDYADITDAEKHKILRDNAVSLLKLDKILDSNVRADENEC